MEIVYAAHTRTEADGSQIIQTLPEHAGNAAGIAAWGLAVCGLSSCGLLLGWLHDSGKCHGDWQTYLLDGIGARGSVNHTFAGVRMLLEKLDAAEEDGVRRLCCELLALASGAHHGLFDCFGEGNVSALDHRRGLDEDTYQQVKQRFLETCMDADALDALLNRAVEELTRKIEAINALTEDAEDPLQEACFFAGLLERLLLSALMEGDRRDTAEFMQNIRYPEFEPDACFWNGVLERVENYLLGFPNDTPVQQARREISQLCADAAGKPGGIYTLCVPTGGGKTLSSLRYALAHAARYNKKRIIFTSPLLSILEQNAEVIRKAVQDDALILEHHSNLVEDPEDGEELNRRDLLTETWEAPIIITTLVQLLNTIFSGKGSCIRRFHALCGSVLVIDEVQTVPSNMLTLFTSAMRFLANICGTTVILCSATQPNFAAMKHPLRDLSELISLPTELLRPFRRTKITEAGAAMSLEEIAAFARERLEQVNSLLVVCNKRSEVSTLYRQLSDCQAEVYVLSAAMCAAHRRDTLRKLEAALEQGRKVLCLSTQVIEAGVDISFDCAIRLAAGMDRVVQTAGRCNRHGDAETVAPVYVVQCRGEDLRSLPEIQDGKAASGDLLCRFREHPEKFESDLGSKAALDCYYSVLYGRKAKDAQDFPLPNSRKSLYTLLGANPLAKEQGKYMMQQAFRTAGAAFCVIEQDTVDVLVRYGGNEEILADLRSERGMWDAAFARERLKQAGPYTVALYRNEAEAMKKEQALVMLPCGAMELIGHYDAALGFRLKETELEFWEV